MSKELPSREQAIRLLQKNGCPRIVVRHCEAVAKVALELAGKLQSKGVKVDLRLVEDGALLHDLGRSKTNGVDHGLIGAQIAESEGLPQPLVKVIIRHVGGGITPQEAEQFGWPKNNYMPQTIEEKIVSYADKVVDNGKRVPIDLEIERLKPKYPDAAERVRRIHQEIEGLIQN